MAGGVPDDALAIAAPGPGRRDEHHPAAVAAISLCLRHQAGRWAGVAVGPAAAGARVPSSGIVSP